jgi:hypothetical protein
LRYRAALADRATGGGQARAQHRVQELGAHVERGDERHAAAQQHADRSVEARELVDLEPFADRRHAPQRVAEPRAQACMAPRVDDERDRGGNDAENDAAVRVDCLTP